MKNKTFWFRSIGLAVLVLVIAGGFILAESGTFKAEADPYQAFAECVTDEGMVFYGADWCGHCQHQKALFGDAFRSIRYVNCQENGAMCQNRGVRSYPTWYHNNEPLTPGVQTFEMLEAQTGCPAPTATE